MQIYQPQPKLTRNKSDTQKWKKLTQNGGFYAGKL